jgi:FSR family fosmidomycin resistance protein-like MFS transporter
LKTISSKTANKEQNPQENSFHLTQVITMAAAHAAHDIYTSFLSPLLPILIEDLSLLKVQGGLLSAFLLWPSVLQPVFGRIADSSNLKKYVFLAPAITAIFMSLLGVSQNFTMLAIVLLIAGISSAGFHAIAPAIAGRISGNEIGKGMSFWMVGGALGWMIGPIVIISVVTLSSIQATPWLMVGGIAASCVLFFLLKDIHARTPPLNNGISLNSSLKAIMPMMLPMIGIITARSLMRGASHSFLPVYLTEQGAGLWLAGTSQSIQLSAGVIGTLIGGSIRDRIGSKPIILISILGSILFMVLFLHTQGVYQIITLLFMGLFSMMVLPVSMAMVQEYSPESRSLANGLYLALLFSINAVAGIVIGYLYDQFGGYQAFMWSAIIGLLGIPFVFMLPRGKENNQVVYNENEKVK